MITRSTDNSALVREIVVVVGIGVLVHVLFVAVIYPAVGWPASAPVPARTLIMALVILWLIWRAGQSGAEIGLIWPQKLGRALGIALIIMTIDSFALTPLTDILIETLGFPRPDSSFFAHVHGNLPALLGWIVVAWVVGGFAEEVVSRGWLMTRLSTLFGGGRAAWAAALLIQAFIFGAGHSYQGAGGAIITGITAIYFGIVFLILKRNLLPLILAHGLWDTIGLTLVFLNGIPPPP